MRAGRILFFQFGDYAEAWRRLDGGGPETYRDQRASVDFVASLAARAEVVTVSVGAPEGRVTLAPGLHADGIDRARAQNLAAVGALLDREAPGAIVCRTPNRAVLGWAARRGVPTLPAFADLFANDGPRALWRNLRLRLALSAAVFPCVANHSRNASASVARALGIPRRRVVAWDWSRLSVTPARETRLAAPGRLTLFYAGMLSEAKGVGDAIDAVAMAVRRGRDVRLTLAGGGDLDAWTARAAEAGVAERVGFLGLVPHAEVRARMATHDAVLIPSRHSYPEGLPNVVYEALAARTPAIASDHPAFEGRLIDGVSAVVFRAGKPAAMAEAFARLMDDAGLYARLCEGAKTAHDALYFGIEWDRLVTLFLDDPEDATGWVAAHSLAALEGAGTARAPA